MSDEKLVAGDAVAEKRDGSCVCKISEAPAQKLVAGDDVVEKRAADGTTDKAGEAHIEVVAAPVAIEAPVEVPTDAKLDGIRCSTCRVIKKDSELMKQPLGYKTNPDGSVELSLARYSIFCGTCQKFLGIYDPVAQNELDTMLRNRNESAKKK